MIDLKIIKQQAVKAISLSILHENGCLEYNRSRGGKNIKSKGEYGRIRVQINNVIHLSAHRTVYMAHHNKIIDSNVIVMHNCDNPKCINVGHLKEGTHLKNAKDRNLKGRQAKGINHGCAKLNESQVREIRSSLKSNTEVAKEYKVDKALIIKIRDRRLWKHI